MKKFPFRPRHLCANLYPRHSVRGYTDGMGAGWKGAVTRRLIIVLLVLPLAACGLFVSKETRAMRRSPDYKAGYQDGCNSVPPQGADKTRDDDIVRDEEEYRSNKAYRTGWNRGRAACRVSNTGYDGGALPGTSPNSGPIPDMNPGNGGLPPR